MYSWNPGGMPTMSRPYFRREARTRTLLRLALLFVVQASFGKADGFIEPVQEWPAPNLADVHHSLFAEPVATAFEYPGLPIFIENTMRKQPPAGLEIRLNDGLATDEFQSATVKLPKVACDNSDDKPVYDGFAFVAGATDLPGVDPIRIREVIPYLAKLQYLEPKQQYEVKLNIWCGTEKLHQITDHFTTRQGAPHSFHYIRIMMMPVMMMVDIYYDPISIYNHQKSDHVPGKGLVYEITACSLDTRAGCQVSRQRPPGGFSEKHLIATQGRLELQIQPVLHTETQEHHGGLVRITVDNRPGQMPPAFNFTSSFEQHEHELAPLEVKVHTDANIYHVSVLPKDYECAKYGGPKYLELTFPETKNTKVLIRANLELNRHGRVHLFTKVYGSSEPICIEGFLKCVENEHQIRVGAKVIPPQGPNETEHQKDPSEFPDRLSFKLSTQDNSSAVTIKYPAVKCFRGDPIFRGIGVPRRVGPGAHMYRDPPIVIESKGTPTTFKDLDFWTTYVVMTTLFCGDAAMPFNNYFDEFYTGPGRLQDIEQLGVDVANGQTFATILTMRYNFTEEVQFTLKVCEGHGVFDGAGCQETKATRSAARTRVKIATQPNKNYTLTAFPSGTYKGEQIYGRSISLPFTTETCDKQCLDSFTNDADAHPFHSGPPMPKAPFADVGKEPGVADIKVPLPNPCMILRPDNVSLEYIAEKGDRRGFKIVNSHQYNMFGLTLEDFRTGIQVHLKAELSCRDMPFTFKYAGSVSTAGLKRQQSPEGFDYIDPRQEEPKHLQFQQAPSAKDLEKIRFILIEETDDGGHHLKFSMPEVDCSVPVQYNITACDVKRNCIVNIVKRLGRVSSVQLNATGEQLYEVTVRPLGQYSVVDLIGYHAALTVNRSDRPTPSEITQLRNDFRTVLLSPRLQDYTGLTVSVMIPLYDRYCESFEDGSTVRYASLYLDSDRGRYSHLVVDLLHQSDISFVLPDFHYGSNMKIVGKFVCQHGEQDIDFVNRNVPVFGMIETGGMIEDYQSDKAVERAFRDITHIIAVQGDNRERGRPITNILSDLRPYRQN